MESRYGTRLVVVVPFTEHDFERLERNIGSWSHHLPCNPARDYAQFVDVAFYFNRELWNTAGIVAKIKKGQTWWISS